MKRGKGICAFALTVAVSGTVFGVSGAFGSPGSAHADPPAAAVLAAGDPGGSRGGGGGGDQGGGQGSQGAGQGSQGAGQGSQGAGQGSQGGGQGSQDGGQGSQGGGQGSQGGSGGGQGGQGDQGGNRGGGSGGSGGSGGQGGGGQGASTQGAGNPQGGQRGQGGQSGGGGGQSGGGGGQSQGSPAQGSGNGQQGRGTSNTSGQGGNSGSQGRCNSSCHVSEQPTAVGIPTFTPAPTPTTSTPTLTPAPVPVVTPKPVTTPTPTSTYSSAASDPASRPASPGRGGLVGLGATVSPALGGGVGLGGTGIAGAGAGPLGTLIGPVSITTAGANRFRHSTKIVPARAITPAPAPPRQTVFEHFVSAVPTAIWIALAAALMFAGVAGASALLSRHRVRRQAGQFAVMSAAALTDALTGVLNRRGFTEAAERELARARRYDRPFVLAYVDVRGLKAVNDTEGHRAGDELLTQAAHLLKESARADDVVGRIGGDEMVLLLVEQTAEGAAVVRRRIEAEVLARRAAMGLRSSWDLTIGTAAFPEDGDSVDELLRAADLRLYEQRGIALH